jgi:hypothetical protein
VTGRPVASANLTQHLECSSATIRNELAALEEHGLLHQPHHSAGRQPTAAGMRLYVRALGALPPLRPRSAAPSTCRFGDLVHGPDGMRAAVRVLSELVGCVAVTFVGEGRRGVMRQVDLVPVQGAQALVVVVTLADGGLARPPGLARPAASPATRRAPAAPAGAAALAVQRQDAHEARDRPDAHVAPSRRRASIACWPRACGSVCGCARRSRSIPLWVQIAGQRLLAGQSGDQRPRGADPHMLTLFDDYHASPSCSVSCSRSGRDAAGRGPRRAPRAGPRPGEPGVPVLGLSLVGCRVQPATTTHKTPRWRCSDPTAWITRR